MLLAALVVAVTALTGVGFFTDRIARPWTSAPRRCSRRTCALRGTDPSLDGLRRARRRAAIATARTISFPSVVFFGEDSALTAIRAVGPGYPLRGKLKVSEAPFAPARETDELPAHGETWLDSRLLARLGAVVGDRVNIGAAVFTVTRVLDYRPDQGSAFTDLAPTLLIPIDDLPTTELLGPGSRATYSLLFAGKPADIRAFGTEIRERMTKSERLVGVAEESSQIQSSPRRAGRFLNLSAMITVLLAAIAVAMAARRYTQRHLDSVALMKCMGAPQRLVLQVTVIELALVALVAAGAGATLGYLAQELLTRLLGDLVRADLPPPTLAPAWLGAATALAILVGFALPPMLQLKRVPPARVLRRNLEPPPLRYSLSYGLAIATLIGILLWLVRDARLVAYVAAGIGGTLAVLYGAGYLLVRLAGRLRGAVGVAWRYGVANLARRGRESVVQVVAFGLGLMVLLLLAVVRGDLLETWRASLPADTPNYFMINIPDAETRDFARFIEERGQPAPRLFPMIRARMSAINGKPIEEIKPATEHGQAFAEREQNLSWAETPQTDNKITSGRWWTEADRGKHYVSVASEYQEELDLKLGDRLAFDVAGGRSGQVLSFREVEWDSFRPNFFRCSRPARSTASRAWLPSMNLEPGQRNMLVDLVRHFHQCRSSTSMQSQRRCGTSSTGPRSPCSTCSSSPGRRHAVLLAA